MLFDTVFRRNGRTHLTGTQEYLKPLVFGGNDGIVTTFAIVSGFAGASAEGVAGIGTIAVLVFGLANLLADALSMGLGEFLSGRSQRDLYDAERRRLLERMAANPATGRAAIQRVLTDGGLDADAARDAGAILMHSPSLTADLILSRGLDVPVPSAQSPALNGLMTFIAFVALGLLPLLPYLAGVPDAFAFSVSVGAAALALFCLGVLRWQATGERPLRAIGETLLVGGLCAVAAYGVGALVAG